MKISVIGSTSFVGKHFISTLASEHEVFVYSRTKTKIPQTKATVNWSHFDVESVDMVALIEQLLLTDVILYCVASGVQPKNIDTEGQIWKANCFFPVELVEQLQGNDFKGKLITFGSYFELGKANIKELLSEKEFLNSKAEMPNAYCASKKCFSDYVSIKHLSKLSFVHIHAILTNIYGEGENENRLIPYIFDSVIKGDPLEFSSGIQKRQYTHITDIANWLNHLLYKNLSKKDTGVYHITDDQIVTVREVIEQTLSFLEGKGLDVRNVSFKDIQKRDSEMLYLGVSSNKALNNLDWTPKVSLAEGVSEYYEGS